MTNYDRIRAMSVEEMAELLTRYDVDSNECFSVDGKWFSGYEEDKAIAASVAYLKSEAKE